MCVKKSAVGSTRAGLKSEALISVLLTYFSPFHIPSNDNVIPSMYFPSRFSETECQEQEV